MRVPPDAKSPLHGRPALRAYARSLRSPKQNTWYGDADPRSWHVALLLRRDYQLEASDLRRGTSIVRSTRSSGRYLCNLPRSGTNWLVAMISCGLTLDAGGSGAFELVADRTPAGDDEWVFEGARHGWPGLPRGLAMALSLDRDRAIGQPAFLYGHEPLPQGLIDHRRARPVVTVRDPFAAARSQVVKDGIEWTLAEPGRLATSVDRTERFFTVWEQRLVDPDAARSTLVLAYEDLIADPTAALVLIDRHWDLGIDEATWADAAERCAWSEMERTAGERRDTTRISLERTDVPADVTEYLHQRCDGLGSSLRARATAAWRSTVGSG